MAKLSSTQIYGDLQVDGEIKNKATTETEGVVQLNDAINNDSIVQGATANAVKKVNDSLSSHKTDTTSHITASERTTWNSKAEGSHSHSYLPLSGGNLSGAVNFPNNKWNNFGDDVSIGDCNEAGRLGIKGLNGATGIVFTPYTGTVSQHLYIDGSGKMSVTGSLFSNGQIGHLNSSGVSTCFDTYNNTNPMIRTGGTANQDLDVRGTSDALRATFKTSGDFYSAKDLYANNGSNKVYHTGNKPTPADIGASASNHTHSYLPLSGGTLTGNLTIKTTSAGAISVISGDYTALMGCSSSTKGDFLFGGKTTSSSSWENYIRLSTNKLIFYTDGKNYNIYHQGNKPTPTDIGTNKVYKSLTEINSTFTVTTPIKDVILAMEDNSVANISIGVDKGVYPQNYGIVTITKINSSRNIAIFKRILANSKMYTTNYHEVDNPTCTWECLADGGNADTVDGLHAGDFARAKGYTAFGGENSLMTTAQFIELLSSLGAFETFYWVSRGIFAYASNRTISDTGIGNVPLAGSTVEVFGTSTTSCTIRITSPTTASGASPGLAYTEFVYINNGSGYSPGWRKSWNDKNDGSGSGLDADLLDGKHASDFLPISGGTVTGKLVVSGTSDFSGNVGFDKLVYMKIGGAVKELGSYLDYTTFNVTPSTGVSITESRIYFSRRTVHCFLWLTLADTFTLSANSGKSIFTLPDGIAGGAMAQEVNLVGHFGAPDNITVSVRGGIFGDVKLFLGNTVPTSKTLIIQGEWTL